MATHARPSGTLLQNISQASIAARDFGIACKRGLNGLVDQNATQDASLLSEDELRAWRESSEPLKKALPASSNYFVSHNILKPHDASYTAQVNAINLATMLEMLLPAQIRTQYPRYAPIIPLIDKESDNDSQGLTMDQKIESLRVPLLELRRVYLQLCAGRKEKHINYVIRGIIPDICVTLLVIINNALGETNFKLDDLMNVFDAEWLRDESLVPSVFATRSVQEKAVGLWKSEAGKRTVRLQASPSSASSYTWDSLCETILLDALKHLIPSTFDRSEAERSHAKGKTSSQIEPINLSDKDLSNILPEELRTRSPAPSTSAPAVQKKATATVSVNPRLDLDDSLPNTTATPIVVPASMSQPEDIQPKSRSKGLLKPKHKTIFARLQGFITSSQEPDAEEESGEPAAPSQVESTALPKVKEPTPLVPKQDSIDQALAKAPTSTASVSLAEKSKGSHAGEETRITAPPYPSSASGYPRQLFSHVSIPALKNVISSRPLNGAQEENIELTSEKGAKEKEKDSVSPPQVVDLSSPTSNRTVQRVSSITAPPHSKKVVRLTHLQPGPGSELMDLDLDGSSEDGEGEDTTSLPPRPLLFPNPLERRREIPSDFVFNRRQVGATKATFTPTPSPSPEPENRRAGSRSRSMVDKIKKTVNDRTRTISTSTAKSSNTSATMVPKPHNGERKRKAGEEEEEALMAKKRKVGDGMMASTTYAARHSTAFESTPTDPATLASPSTAKVPLRNAASPSEPVRTKPKPHVVMAATSSDSEEDIGSRARRNAKRRADLLTRNQKPVGDRKLATAPGPTEFPPRRPNLSYRGPISIDASDRRLKEAKSRIEELKKLSEEQKKTLAALEDEEDSKTETSGDEYQPPPASNIEEDKALDSEAELERSKQRIADIKARAAKAKDPLETRQRHLPVESDEESEPTLDTGKKKRGRPRRAVTSDVEEPAVPVTKRKNKYATGGNETGGRMRWSEEEDKTLLFALEALYYSGKMTKPWIKILERHGPQGTDDQKLARRNVVQLKDRARNIAKRHAAKGEAIPVYLNWITLPTKKG